MIKLHTKKLLFILFVTLGTFAGTKSLDVAILESLKPNNMADWTQTAADEYEMGIKAGKNYCSIQRNIDVQITRYYFAGKEDEQIKFLIKDLKSKSHDLIVGPGNHENIVPLIADLSENKVISPLARSADVINGIKNFVPMHKPANLIIEKLIPFLKSKGTKKIIVLYNPSAIDSVSIKKKFEEVSPFFNIALVGYPLASFSESETMLASKHLSDQNKSVAKFETVVIAPFLTKQILAITSAFQRENFSPTTISFGLPPQFSKLADSSKIKVPIYDVRLYEQSFLDRKNSVNWYTKLIARNGMEPKTPLPYFVASVFKKVCDEYINVKSDWRTFQKTQFKTLERSDVWLAQIIDGHEIFIKI